MKIEHQPNVQENNIISSANINNAEKASPFGIFGLPENSGVNEDKVILNNPPSGRSYININNIPKEDIDKYNIHMGVCTINRDRMSIPILVNNLTSFTGIRPEWARQLKHFIRAADELGITIVLSEVARTEAASDAGHRRNPIAVREGGDSPHNYGIALDILLVYKDGKRINIDGPLYKKFAHLVTKYSKEDRDGTLYSVKWGGDFEDEALAKLERHHFQLYSDKYTKVEDWRKEFKKDNFLIKTIKKA